MIQDGDGHKMERERIDKVLANAGMGSRQEVKAALKKGLVYSAVENWDRLFERLRKHIAVCPYCGMDYFQQSGKHLICRKCQKPLVSPEIEACDSAERTDDLGWTDG